MKRILLLFCIVTLVHLSARGDDNGTTMDYYSLTFELYENPPKAQLISTKDLGSAGTVTVPKTIPHENKRYEVYKIKSNVFKATNTLRSINIEANITELDNSAFLNFDGSQNATAYFRFAPPKHQGSPFSYCSALLVCFNAIYEKETGLLTAQGYRTNKTETIYAGLSVKQFLVPANAYWYTTKHNTRMEPTHPENFLMDSVYNQYVYKQGSVTQDRELTYIPAFAFTGKGELTTFTVPRTVTEIQTGAFLDCSKLQQITMRSRFYSDGILPNVSSITRLGDYAFMRCQSLTNIQMPQVTTLGQRTFEGCKQLASVVLGNRIESIPLACFKNCTAINNLTFNYCLNIDEEAFSGCSALTSINIPYVTTIGRRAFANCTELEMPDLYAATFIDDEAFIGCTALTDAYWDEVTKTGKNVLTGCTDLELINMSNLNEMGDGLARGCTNLKEAVFDSTLHTVAASAFKDCKKLTTCSAPALWAVKDSAFYNCSQLTSIDLSHLTDIRNAAFAHCSSLQEISLGQNVISIGKNAFDGCAGVKRVVCMTVVPPILGDSAFSHINTKEITLFVPHLSVDAYRHSDWGKYEWKQIYPYYDIEVASPLYEGDTIALVAQADKADFIQGDLRFYSSDSNYVAVNNQGVVIAKKRTDNDVPYVTITAILDNTICYHYLRFTVNPGREPEYTIHSSVIGQGTVAILGSTKIPAKKAAKCVATADAGHFLKRIYALQTGTTDTVPLYQDPANPTHFHWTMPKANVTIYAEFKPILNLRLEETKDYETELEAMLNEVKNVTLVRTFKAQRIGSICLPFDLPDLSQTPFKDAHVGQVTTVQRDYVHGLLITYSDVKAMKAGYPYVIYFNKGTKDVQFDSVRITAAASTPVTYYSADSTSNVIYQGLMKPQLLYRNDSSTLFYNKNIICYPTKNLNVGAFKGYYIFNQSTWGVNIINWRMDNGFTLEEAQDEDDSEESLTDILSVKADRSGVDKVLYNGNLFIIRDDKIYNAQGQLIIKQ